MICWRKKEFWKNTRSTEPSWLANRRPSAAGARTEGETMRCLLEKPGLFRHAARGLVVAGRDDLRAGGPYIRPVPWDVRLFLRIDKTGRVAGRADAR